jgi:hypothetical protein
MDAHLRADDHRGVVRRASLLLGRSRLDPVNVAVAGGTPSPGAATLVDRVDAS